MATNITKRKVEKLTPKNEFLRVRLLEFCFDYGLSQKQFSDLCGGTSIQFGKSKAGYFFKGKVTNAFVDKMRPIISETLVQYLLDKGKTMEEVEETLEPILNEEYVNMLANRSMLTSETIKFFGLKHDPFDVDKMPYADDLFTTPELDETVARVTEAVLHQRFVAVIGAVGTGKTLLKERVAFELSESSQDARLLYPTFFDMEEVSVAAIATQILLELGQPVPNSKPARLKVIKEILTQMSEDDIRVALVMDECHRLSDKVISSLKNFWELNNGAFSRLMGIILLGQPVFVDARLRKAQFKEIRQRVQIIPMPELNSSAPYYLAHRVNLAGGSIDKLFGDAAIRRICESATTALALGNLCNQALNEAAELDEKTVRVSQPFFKKLNSGNQVLAMRKRAV